MNLSFTTVTAIIAFQPVLCRFPVERRAASESLITFGTRRACGVGAASIEVPEWTVGNAAIAPRRATEQDHRCGCLGAIAFQVGVAGYQVRALRSLAVPAFILPARTRVRVIVQVKPDRRTQGNALSGETAHLGKSQRY